VFVCLCVCVCVYLCVCAHRHIQADEILKSQCYNHFIQYIQQQIDF